MRLRRSFVGVAAVMAGPLLLAQDGSLTQLNVGDAVDYYTANHWMPCTVASPLRDGAYTLSCGAAELHAHPIAAELRLRAIAHVSLGQSLQPPDEPDPPRSQTPGARFGTREPRTCQERKIAISKEVAEELLVCEFEHEQDGQLSLVSDLTVQLASPSRPFDAVRDSKRPDIDPQQPVYDLRAAYNHFQCRPIDSKYGDFPGTRNCSIAAVTDAVGACFLNPAKEWRCMVDSSHEAPPATDKVCAPMSDQHPPLP